MRSVCAVCDEAIVSTVTGEQWFHQPAGQALKVASDRPRPHSATPVEVEHTCTRSNRFCPRCIDVARSLVYGLAVLKPMGD